jgi:N-acetylmuramoyl-L-alanine amidase
VGIRRLVVAVAITVIAAIAVPLAIIYSGDGSGAKPATTTASTTSGGSSAATTSKLVIAWNPSHQNDTGTGGWHEYAVCGDITKRTMALLTGFTNVLCWETGMGLTSKTVAALKSECDAANAANARIFIAVHVNGGSGSGLTGDYYAGDTASRDYGEAILRSTAATMGMTFYYVKPRSNLYVLNPAHNKAAIRVLLELGDNVADRALLTSAEGRQRLAAALAKAVKENVPST